MLNYTNFSNIKKLRNDFKTSLPYRHLVFDDFLSEDIYKSVFKEFNLNVAETINYIHFSQNKYGLTKIDKMGNETQKLMNFFASKKFLNLLSSITEIENLKFDFDLHNAGLHGVKKGGYLNIHRDFGTHPTKLTWRRRLNILIYFNEVWDNNWGGELELWNSDRSKCEKKISPIKNKCVLFDTTEGFHGHPEPLKCPENVIRKSIALYFFTDEKKKLKTVSTFYTTSKQDPLVKKIIIFFDRQLVKVYNLLIKNFNIKNDKIEKLLIFFFKKKKNMDDKKNRRQHSFLKNKLIGIVEEIFRSSALGYGISRYLAGKYFYKFLGEADFEFFKFIEMEKNKIFIDIGANDGISALTFRLFNKENDILSFEPDTYHNKSLERVKRKLNNFDYLNLGIGKSKEELTLYIPKCGKIYIGQLASVFKDEAKNNVAKIISKKNILDEVTLIEKKIKIVTIDEMNLQPAAIKIDIEGYEHEAIQGGINTIKKYEPILMIEVNEKSFEKMKNLLNELNYSVFVFNKNSKKINIFNPKLINDKNVVINLICISKNKIDSVKNLIE